MGDGSPCLFRLRPLLEVTCSFARSLQESAGKSPRRTPGSHARRACRQTSPDLSTTLYSRASESTRNGVPRRLINKLGALHESWHHPANRRSSDPDRRPSNLAACAQLGIRTQRNCRRHPFDRACPVLDGSTLVRRGRLKPPSVRLGLRPCHNAAECRGRVVSPSFRYASTARRFLIAPHHERAMPRPPLPTVVEALRRRARRYIHKESVAACGFSDRQTVRSSQRRDDHRGRCQGTSHAPNESTVGCLNVLNRKSSRVT